MQNGSEYFCSYLFFHLRNSIRHNNRVNGSLRLRHTKGIKEFRSANRSEKLRVRMTKFRTDINRQFLKEGLTFIQAIQHISISLRQLRHISIEALDTGEDISFTIGETLQKNMNIARLSKRLDIIIQILSSTLFQTNPAFVIIRCRICSPNR
nr:MAG TPA: hypothetical protein [Microviridae sp.]